MLKLLIGTRNESKLTLMKDYLADLPVMCVSPADMHIETSPAENRKTALENAVFKARSWFELTGLPVVAEDSGLVFLDLPDDHPDQPGVMVRRRGSHVMNDDEMLAWYQRIIEKHGGQLSAAWEDAWCIYAGTDCCYTYTYSRETLRQHARLLLSPPCQARVPGWPLDSLTYFPQAGKYKAEMSMEEMLTAGDARQGAKDERNQLVNWLRQTVADIAKRTEE